MGPVANDDGVVSKVMSLTLADFARSISVLAGEACGQQALDLGRVRVPVDTGHVDISFEVLPRRRLGGLLDLPQAGVKLRFGDVDASQRVAFLRRFDLAFQRGGG